MKKSSGGRFADTMTVSANSWHGKAYTYWQRNHRYKNAGPYRVNLCHYVRVVFVWAPLTVVYMSTAWRTMEHWSDTKSGKVAGSIFWILFWVQGLLGLGYMAATMPGVLITWILTLVLGGALLLGVAALMVALSDRSSFQLMWQALVAKKRGICPYINIQSEEPPELAPT